MGAVHLGLAMVAMAVGAAVVAVRKGTGLHRRIGWVYVGAMVGANVTALFIYDLFDGFGPFHVLAVVSLAMVVIGTGHAALRKPRGRWRDFHAYWMSWSYVGLLAAAASEVTTRVPESPFWGMVLLASGAVLAIGAVVIVRTVPRALGRVPRP